MSSDLMRVHKETNATKGGAPIEGCSCCLQGESKSAVSSMLLGGFQCLRTRFVSTKTQMRPREVRR
jgi:hypothetical protein